MQLDSFLEIFVTMYGWTIANLIYSLLLDTGIAFIPLIVLVVSVAKQAHVDGTENGGAQWAIRKMEVEVFCACFVMATCFVPTAFTTLDSVNLKHRPDPTVAVPAPATVDGSSSGTTYDGAFASATSGSIPVPIWWYTVMSVSSGFSASVRAGVANGGFLGLREAEQVAQLATIESPALRSEAQVFTRQCWSNARGIYFDPSTVHSATVEAIQLRAIYGKDDTEWIGSHSFLDDPLYYSSLRAEQPIPGFLPDPLGDDSDAAPGDPTSRPNCKRWWLEAGPVGLRARLMDQSNTRLKTAMDYVAGIWVARGGGGAGAPSLDDIKDSILRQALYRTQANFSNIETAIGGDNASRSGVLGFLSNFGIAKQGVEASFSYGPVVTYMTLAQPLLLMGIFIFLPLITVFSGYKLEFMFHGALAIFSVKMWPAMWSIAKFVDERLVEAMYGDNTILVREFFTNGFDGGAKRAVLNALTLGLFAGLPLIWSTMMGWIGFKVGQAINDAVASAHSSGTSAGRTTAGAIGGVVGKAANAATGGVGGAVRGALGRGKK